MSNRYVRWLFLLIVLFASFLSGQSKKEPSRSPAKSDDLVPIFKEKVRRVLVDIVVRDSDGRAVHGLTPQDFSVSEDGKPQHVVSFEEYKFDSPSIALPANAPALPSNTFINVPQKPQRGPLYVIFYDMVNMEQEDQITARQHVVRFIDSKPDGTRFAIYVNSDGLYLIQGFTDDKKLLHAALDPNHPPQHMPKIFLMGRNFGRGDAISSVHILTHIGAFLEGLPGRKNLLWMSGTFPVALFPKQGDPQDLKDEMKRQLDTLTRAQVAIYPVNVRGVVTNPEGALTGITPYSGSTSVEPLQQSSSGGGTQGTSAPAASGTSPGGAADRSTAALRTANQLQDSGASGSVIGGYMVEDSIAALTGGKAFHGDNDISAVLSEATEQGGNYYSLSYAPTNPSYNGSLRNIRIKVNHPGYTLSYRRSYYADDPDAPIPEHHARNTEEEDAPEQARVAARERPLYASLQHGAPLLHDVILKVRIHAEGESRPASDDDMAHLAKQPAYVRPKHGEAAEKLHKGLQLQRYAIYYAITNQQITQTRKGPIPLEFAAVAFDREGAVLNGVFEIAAEEPRTPSESDPKQNVYRAMQELDVPQGAKSIRVAVRDTVTNRIGAMEIPLPIAPEPQSVGN